LAQVPVAQYSTSLIKHENHACILYYMQKIVAIMAPPLTDTNMIYNRGRT